MTDKEIWLILYHAILSSPIPIGVAAEQADEALVEYKKRWANGN